MRGERGRFSVNSVHVVETREESNVCGLGFGEEESRDEREEESRYEREMRNMLISRVFD